MSDDQPTPDGSSRRDFLKRAAAGVVGTAFTGGAAREGASARQGPDPEDLTPVADLPDDVTRTWLASPYWGNRLQDWRLHNGRLECLRGEASYEVRTVAVLTREIVQGNAPGHLAVRTGLIEGEDQQGFCGFLMGVGEGELDHRAAALAQRGSGLGGGFMATFEMDGRVRFREHTNREQPLAFSELSAEKRVAEGGAVQPSVEQDVQLQLDILPQGDGHFDVEMTAQTVPGGEFLAGATRKNVPEEEFLGGILLVSSPPPEEAGTRWWFEDLRTGGDKIAAHPERALGPVLGALHSLNQDVLKLSAQLMPVADSMPQTVRLAYRPAGSNEAWQTTSTTLEPGYVALFRIDGWDASRDWEYRVLYPAEGDELARYSGRIKSDPGEDGELRVGLFSCVLATGRQLEAGVDKPALPMAKWLGRYRPGNMYFPHNQLVQNASAHEPDLLVFCGDQLYEHSPTRPAGTVHPKLDYLYKWYLWMWAFRDMARDTPSVMLIDDHDVYHPNVWGEGGEQTPEDVPTPWNYGGYMGTAAFINMVQRTQCGHNPDPYDPTPVKRDITVYYSAFRYGGVDFAILEDRKFKTAPLQGEDLNVHEPELLGPRQERFLAEWGQDQEGSRPKICLTQTLFGSLQTSPDGDPLIDFDANGYPKRQRDQALELLREAGALILAGDQHLGSLVRHGVDTFTDGPVQFTGPAGGSFWQRWFEPTEELPNGTGHPNTGDFKDAFGNKMRVLAVANPKISFATFREHVKGRTQSVLDRTLKREGYGLVRIQHDRQAFVIECWPWDEDPTASGAEQFAGWPYRLPFSESTGR